MYIYRISSYSYEGHSECYVSSPHPVSDEDLNAKVVRVFEAAARRSREWLHNLEAVFDVIEADQWEEEGLTLIRPVKDVRFNGWAPLFSNRAPDDRLTDQLIPKLHHRLNPAACPQCGARFFVTYSDEENSHLCPSCRVAVATEEAGKP